MPQHPLQPLLEPKSIAVVGASPNRKSYARNVMNGCLNAGFDGDLHLVNPRYDEVEGRPCYPSLTDVPEPIDHALLVVANDRMEAVVEQAIKAEHTFQVGLQAIGRIAHGVAAFLDHTQAAATMGIG